MTDRKTLKIHPETKARLDDLKDGETTDGLLNRAFDALEEQRRRGNQQSAPICGTCGERVTTWTLIEGAVACEDCADINFSEL